MKIPARVRASGGWADACILNVSSRGMMINAARPSAIQGGTIELWHGEKLVVGTVMWRKGTRAGLRSEERVPVDEILAASKEATLQLTAAPALGKKSRIRLAHAESRLRGRAMEFAALSIVASLLAVGAFAMVEQAFARPLMVVQSALR